MSRMRLSVKEAEQAAKTAEKFPWGTSIVVALLSTLVVYIIMSKQVSWAMERADNCQQELSTLTTRIMVKNNIIEKQTDTIFVQRRSGVRRQGKATTDRGGGSYAVFYVGEETGIGSIGG